MTTSSTTAPTETTTVEGALSPRGRRLRLLATIVAGMTLVVGTFWGSDDDFPFGPFKMYSHTNSPDGIVGSNRVEAIDVTGRRFKLSDAATGLRRAEIEGQIPRFEADPELLATVAEAYATRHPDAPALVRIEIVRRRYRIEDHQPTGEVDERVVVTWEADT
jgi:hypothetical protein